MMKILFSFLLCSLLIITTACKNNIDNDDSKKVHIGLVLDMGGKDDKSFNAAAWEGGKKAKTELPIILRDVEPGEPTSLEPSMRAFAERGYDLVIGVGFAQSPILEQVAKDYPNTHFAIVDAIVDLPNVASLVFNEHEGCFLVGMIAAHTTKTNKIGFIGGMDIPLIHKFSKGYEEGIHYVNPMIEVKQNFVGYTDAAWNNPGKGKELAKAQFDSGVDIIFQAAGNSGIGVFDAAEETNKFAIGVDSNQNWVKPGTILTSMVKRVDTAVYSIIKEVVENKFTAGIHTYGLENNGVIYSVDQYNKSLISEKILREVELVRTKIINGEIKVTNAMLQ